MRARISNCMTFAVEFSFNSENQFNSALKRALFEYWDRYACENWPNKSQERRHEMLRIIKPKGQIQVPNDYPEEGWIHASYGIWSRNKNPDVIFGSKPEITYQDAIDAQAKFTEAAIVFGQLARFCSSE
jgi:hypothetical protein